MPTVQQDIQIDATADDVWRVAGDPGRIADWLPPIESSRVDEGHAHVSWTAEFETEEQAQEEEVVQTFQQIYSGGLEALKAKVEQRA